MDVVNINAGETLGIFYQAAASEANPVSYKAYQLDGTVLSTGSLSVVEDDLYSVDYVMPSESVVMKVFTEDGAGGIDLSKSVTVTQLRLDPRKLEYILSANLIGYLDDSIGSRDNKRITIVQGEDRSFDIRLYNGIAGSPVDLTGLTEAKACFLNANGSLLEKTLGAGVTVVDLSCGSLRVNLSDLETPSLLHGQRQDMELTLTINGVLRKVKFHGDFDIHCSIH